MATPKCEAIATPKKLYIVQDTDSDSSDSVQDEPIKLEVGDGNFKRQQSSWCILGCLPCLRTPTKEWQFELIYLLIHILSGVPIVYAVIMSQALSEISKNGYNPQYQNINTFSWIWISFSFGLLLIRVLIWIWKAHSSMSSSKLCKYNSGTAFRQILYTFAFILHFINMCFSAYWKFSPNFVVIICATLIFLDILGYIMEIIIFCMVFPTTFIVETTQKPIEIEEQQLFGNIQN
eukprot:366597_1